MATRKISNTTAWQSIETFSPESVVTKTTEEIQWLSTCDLGIDKEFASWSSEHADPILASIRERGIYTPLTVRKCESLDNPYEIVDGNIRRICALALGIKTVPATIVNMSDSDYRAHRIVLAKNRRLRQVFGVDFQQATEPLCEIAGMTERWGGLQVDPEELDRIVDGTEGDIDILICKSYWFDGVLKSVNWWREVSEILLGSRDVEYEFRPEASFAHHIEALPRLLNDVLAAYCAAWKEDSYFSEDWMDQHGEAARELLRRYRLFTRHVCAFAKEIWPDVNLETLLNRS